MSRLNFGLHLFNGGVRYWLYSLLHINTLSQSRRSSHLTEELFGVLSYLTIQYNTIISIYFLDSCEDPGRKEDDFPHLKKLEERWMVTMGSLASLDPAAGMNKRDDAKAGARNWGN